MINQITMGCGWLSASWNYWMGSLLKGIFWVIPTYYFKHKKPFQEIQGELASKMVPFGFNFSELSGYYCFFSAMLFMKFNIPSSVSSPGKRPKHVLGTCLKINAWCLSFPAIFSRLYAIIVFIISEHLSQVPLILSGERGAYVCFALFSPLLETGMPCSEDGGMWWRNPPWTFYETSVPCEYRAEYFSKAEPLGNSVTEVQNFVVHLLANTFISPPFGKKSTPVLVGKKDKRNPFA